MSAEDKLDALDEIYAGVERAVDEVPWFIRLALWILERT